MKYLSSTMLSLVLLGIWGCSDFGVSCPDGLDCLGECGGNAMEDCAGTCNGTAESVGDNCTNISYFETIQPIFTANCISCHDVNHGTGLNLISESSLLEGSNSGPVIIDGNHSSSTLWIYIENGYMPYSPAELTDSQIEFIATWIDERD